MMNMMLDTFFIILKKFILFLDETVPVEIPKSRRQCKKQCITSGERDSLNMLAKHFTRKM